MAKSKSKEDTKELLRSILRFMKQNNGLSLSELIEIYSSEGVVEAIPLSIFSHDLSPSESLCKFLKENKQLSFHEIAVLINRDDRSVWTSYSRASKKSRESFSTKADELLLPLQIFTDRDRSILENVILHLKENYSYSNSRIAGLLNKSPSSIATISSRAAKKSGLR
jgi:hypothetical protein